MAVTISVIDNKIRVATTGTNVDAVITKYIISAGVLTEQAVITLEDIISLVGDSMHTPELEDGVYKVVTNDNGTQTNIAFIVSQAKEQKAIYQIETIKTKSHSNQVDTRNYYNLMSFCIHYDILSSAIAAWIDNPSSTYNRIEIVQMFNNLPNYYKS